MSRALVIGMSLCSACLLFSGMAMAQSFESECDAVADNIVANCGFETGDFRPEWTCEFSRDNCRVNNHDVHSGFFAMEIGYDGCISQTLTTVPDQSYDVSFWVPSYAWGGEDFEWSVDWNHEAVARWDTGALLPYRQYEVRGLIGTGADTLTFCGSIGNYYWYIDDIVVLPSPATPR